MLLPDPSAGRDPTAYKVERGRARSQPQHRGLGSLLHSLTWQVTRQFSASGCASPLRPYLLGTTGREEDEAVFTQRPHHCQSWPHHPKSCNLFLLARQTGCVRRRWDQLHSSKAKGHQEPGRGFWLTCSCGPFLHISTA